ncbi:hypothetical protein [Caballeronia sordidicola]|uniref:Uncharacterized protein n=1 Tax=Caballeronia sordidicola TaxID=196367 RepID=A0A242N6Y3_CABSO|nr:hypothetical protein [Caballeronia sordidicola]OTP79449.1 hypothetical protein PAMC26577_00880 [Caballeronia sordidicola]
MTFATEHESLELSAGRPRYGLRVTRYLRENGPARSVVICKAIGINPASGVAPYIKAWIASGRIVKFRDGRYAIAGAVDDSVEPPRTVVIDPQFPTLWQILTDLHQKHIGLRDAYRLAKTHVRAAAHSRADAK